MDDGSLVDVFVFYTPAARKAEGGSAAITALIDLMAAETNQAYAANGVILKAYDLIPSPAYIVLSAAKTFRHPTHRPNELWQTDFTYLQVVGWGWYYLSTVLDDDSRYIIAWALRTSMQTVDVTETLDLARAKTGVDRIRVVHRPRLLSDNGPCSVSAELAT